ncbi:MAG: Unknown protein [uncultured Campylobacterales bacterium]|uniref:Uncharacterized protein n=1 Tax=uncultured Campylobacterales bacterium TaxID=352960 RepID=A0A6S6SJ86_9BACT|nr:MAG: Unknown protein [uncultured Campylobacterales bacterium]
MSTVEIIDYITGNPVLFAFMILLVHSLQRKFYKNIFTAWIFDIFGVFFHEVAHFVVGAILNAKPFAFSVIPQKTQYGYMLGHVQFSNVKWYNAIPTAFAPFLLLILAFYIDKYFFVFFEKNVLSYFLYLFIIVVTITSAIPSSQDFKVARSSFTGIVFYVVLCYIGGYFLIERLL